MLRILIIMTGGLLFGLTGALCFSQHRNLHDKLEPALKKQCLFDPNAYHDVIIQLNGRPEIEFLYGKWLKSGFSQEKISQKLMSCLNQYATSYQAEIINRLKILPGVEHHSIKSYWITNLISCRANSNAISQLSKRQDVKYIMPDFGLVLDDAKAVSSPSPKSPQGHEPGHDIIRAPELWSLGYTGYGRKVLILDSGMDLSHPALNRQYAGNYMSDSLAWFDPEDATTHPVSCGVHGSQVGGIILGLDPTTADTTGVAFESLWMASPVAPNPGLCQATDAIAALQWAMNPDGDTTTSHDMPDVINNSWSITSPVAGQECESIFKDMLTALEMAGIALVWSAGNQGPFSASIASPKNINTNPVNAFCVGAIRGSLSSFPIFPNSSRGPSLCQLSADTIKPEVVAPGENIRSCGLNGTYIFSSGTSFSAPHVSGAVLLLKEAFPLLNGKDLLMALYLTANDLGQTGEDNLYGRGIIDIMAAYEYLLNQGNTPVMVSRNNDVAIQNLQTGQASICDTVAQPSFSLINQGSDSLNEVWITWQYSSGSTDSMHWTGNLPPDSQLQMLLPAFSSPSPGHFSLKVKLHNPNGFTDYHYLDNQQSVSVPFFPFPPDVSNAAIVCIGQNVLLSTQDHMDDLLWFADAVSDRVESRGGKFLTGPIHSDSSFFVARQVNGLIGCRAEINVFVDSGQVNASFVKSDSVIYLARGGQIAFSNQSTGASIWAWDFGDGNRSMDAQPIHTYTQDGTYSVSLIASNGICTDAVLDTIKVLSWALPADPDADKYFNIFPNPCPLPCKIKLQFPHNLPKRVLLTDIQGQKLRIWEITDSVSLDMILNMVELSPGLYFLKAIFNHQTISVKIHLF